MKLLCLLALLSAPIAMSDQSAAQTGTKRSNRPSNATCVTLWSSAMKSSDGTLSPLSVDGMIVNISAVDTDEDGKVSNAEFISACKTGLVSSAEQPDAMSPSAISNAPALPAD
jgi:hypothetical protein